MTDHEVIQLLARAVAALAARSGGSIDTAGAGTHLRTRAGRVRRGSGVAAGMPLFRHAGFALDAEDVAGGGYTGDPDQDGLRALVRELAGRAQPAEGFKFAEIVAICRSGDLLGHVIDGRLEAGRSGQASYRATHQCKSRLGRLLAGSAGRVFEYQDGVRIVLQKVGKERGRRYLVELQDPAPPVASAASGG